MEITAHRGSSAKAPENTLAAFRQAIADDCDGIELDVQTCADRAVVVVHDRDLLRVAGDPRRVEDLTLAELKRIDVGRRFSESHVGEPVPTLAEVIHLVRGKVRLNIELKYNRPDPRLVPAVLSLLRQEQFLDQCVLTSFNADAIREVRTTEPAARTGLILGEVIPGVTEAEVDLLSIAASEVTPDFIRAAHRAGKVVHVWTVNEPEAMRRMIRLGADNLITNQPEVLRGLLNKRLAKPGTRIP
ncbi:MAG: glycerophosphodiester phosphodiesterase [Verrucomicrobia bacterium]|jgi:glycerophosphoryl diester phosphodiesterase|nr:glycerophosphodiester phosphodiesterase [Verrucomicrobiota bacterium]